MTSVRLAVPLRVALYDPNGTELIVTDKVARLRSMRLTLEDDLTSMVHGDVSIEIQDNDGSVESFLDDYTIGEEWTVRIERQVNAPAWELVLTGVLDLPLGISYDRKEKTVDLQVFSYSKKLERTSAETIKRDIEGRTGTGTAASASLTMSSTTDVQPGDKFRIGDSSNNEEITISSVDSGTTATLTAALDNSYTDADMTPLTPYYRSKTLEFLAGEILTASGLTDYDVDLAQSASMSPAVGIANDSNLPAPLALSLVPQSSQIRVVSNSRYYEQPDPTSDFTDTGAATTGQADWTAYKLTEPGTIYNITSAANGRDTGFFGCVDYDTGDRWRTLRTTTGGLPPTSSTLSLQKNESDEVQLDTDSGVVVWNSSVEYDLDNNECWAAWVRGDDSVYSLDIWNGSSKTAYVTGYIVDGLRFVKQLDRMLVYRSDTNKMEFHTLGSGKTKDFEIDAPEGLRHWTFRVWTDQVGTWAAAAYNVSNRLYVRVWDTSDWSVVLDQQVQSFFNSNTYSTLWTGDDGQRHYLLLAYYTSASVYYSDYFIVSTEIFGVIPYADFDGMSCAKALQESCMVTGAVFRVNNDGSVNVRARANVPSTATLELSDPVEWVHRPLWEWYRASVKVTGETESEQEIEEYYGETGDSANRLTVDSRLVTNVVMAASVGTSYISYLSEKRVQEDAEFTENGTIPAPLDKVTFEGSSYIVLENSVDFPGRTMTLRLVSV